MTENAALFLIFSACFGAAHIVLRNHMREIRQLKDMERMREQQSYQRIPPRTLPFQVTCYGAGGGGGASVPRGVWAVTPKRVCRYCGTERTQTDKPCPSCAGKEIKQ